MQVGVQESAIRVALRMKDSEAVQCQVIFGFLLYFCQIVCCCLAPLQDDAKLTRLASLLKA